MDDRLLRENNENKTYELLYLCNDILCERSDLSDLQRIWLNEIRTHLRQLEDSSFCFYPPCSEDTIYQYLMNIEYELKKYCRD